MCVAGIVSGAISSLCSPFYCSIGEFDEGAGRCSTSVCTRSMD